MNKFKLIFFIAFISIALVIWAKIKFIAPSEKTIETEACNEKTIETEVYAEKAEVKPLKPDEDGYIRIFYNTESLHGLTPQEDYDSFKELDLVDDVIVQENGATYVFTPEHFKEYNEFMGKDSSLLKPDEDGYIRVFYDKGSLGGHTPQQMHDANIVNDMIDDVIVHEDGITYVFTPEHLKQYKEIILDGTRLINYIDFTSLKKEPVYTDDLKQNVILYVDRRTFFSTIQDQVEPVFGTINYSSEYQILSGVSTYEWTTAITVVDYKTNKVITSYKFPDENRNIIINTVPENSAKN